MKLFKMHPHIEGNEIILRVRLCGPGGLVEGSSKIVDGGVVVYEKTAKLEEKDKIIAEARKFITSTYGSDAQIE